MARGAESVHCPIQAPQSYVEPYMHLDPNRRTFAGMLAALDEAVPPTRWFSLRRNGVGQRSKRSVGAQVGKVVAGFAEKEMWEATLTVFTTDNGALHDIAAPFHSQFTCPQTLSSGREQMAVRD